MKMIRHLRKSLVKEFGQSKVLTFLEATLKSPLESPEIRQYIMQADKPRLAAYYSPEHQMLHALLGEKLDSYLHPLFPEELISYQKGKKIGDVFTDLKIFLSQYKKKTPVKSQRILGVLKFDIKNYGDSIPLTENSKLWQQLAKVGLGNYIPSLKNELRAIVENASVKHTLIRGVSFGLPTSPPLMNLYLSDFDRHMVKSFPDIFYRRFGDDGLIITEHPDQLQNIAQLLHKELASLELIPHPDKTKTFLWNQSGFKAKSRIEFVGRSVDFNGRMFLTLKKQKVLLQRWKNLLFKIKSVDETYLTSTWNEFVKSSFGEELYTWSNDSDSIKNLSDRIKQLTFKYFEIKKHPDYVDLFTKWHHR